MNKFAAFLIASTALSLAAPGNASVVTLNFAGTIPGTNSFYASGPDSNLTAFQRSYIYSLNIGSSYDFSFSYDTTSTATGGKFPVTFSSMLINGAAMPAGFTPYIAFAQAGTYKYMNVTLQFDEIVGGYTYRSYAFMSLGDNDGDIVLGTLPDVSTPSVYDFINVSFEVYGRSNTYRNFVDSQSRGLSIVPPGMPGPGAPGAVPEPASWALMIGGFAGIGGLLRRRSRTGFAYN